MTTIEVIELRTILDSRGNPTVEADIHTTSGFGRSDCPQRRQYRILRGSCPSPERSG